MKTNTRTLPAVGGASVVPFNFKDHPVRVVMRDGEPWFVCSDVANALGYRNASDAARNLSEHQKGTQIVPTLSPASDTQIVRTTSRARHTQTVVIINESGLYRLVLRSHKPEAVAFSDWVTGEVLPSIRKTGQYQHQPQPQLPLQPEPTATLDAHTLYRVWFLCSHFKHLFRIYRDSRLYQHLTGLGSRVGIEMHDHFLDGMSGGADALERTLGHHFTAARRYLRDVHGIQSGEIQ